MNRFRKLLRSQFEGFMISIATVTSIGCIIGFLGGWPKLGLISMLWGLMTMGTLVLIVLNE